MKHIEELLKNFLESIVTQESEEINDTSHEKDDA